MTQIKTDETDQQIINQIVQLVQFSETEDLTALPEFLELPLRFDKRDINILPSPTKKELRQITDIIKKEEDNNIVKKLFFYLRLHPTMESVPYLFEVASINRILVKRRGFELTVGDNVNPCFGKYL